MIEKNITKKGIITKVSGPLVIAEDVPGARMFDVVKVGDKKLIGEIIGLNRNQASIQVYEDTAGLGPGEPVETTGKPLSVELGPGMMKSIYDGIQRPLNLIFEKSGAFIARGIEVPGISREKAWEFKPQARVGQPVEGGDILGTVQESVLIIHKVMVPPGVEGKLLEIKAGKFKVEDVIAKVETPKSIQEITMLQRWPIRIPRPVKKNLPVNTLMSSGQRVIDTFFPIGQGGTAAVPGPFGSGKCVSADTRVLLATGERVKIKKLFARFSQGDKRNIGPGEEYISLRSPLTVLSYQDGKIVKKRVKGLYKGRTKSLIEIETKTGRKFKVTPIHKLFSLKNLNLQEKEARFFRAGEYIAMPRILPFPGREVRFNPYEIFASFRISDPGLLKKIRQDIAVSSQRCRSLQALARRLKVAYNVLIGYKLGRNKPTLDFVQKLYTFRKEKLPRVSWLKGERESRPVKIPLKLTNELSEWLGLLFAEGSFKGNTLHFYNNCAETQQRFTLLSKRIFGIAPKQEIANTVKCATIFSVVVIKFLKYIGFPEYRKSINLSLPDVLLSASREKIGKFLGAYFVGDGSVGPSGIELATSSAQFGSDLAYLLQRLGILYAVKERKTRVHRAHRLSIYGYENLQKFYQAAVLPYPKLRKLKQAIALSSQNLGSRYDIVPLSLGLIRKIVQSVSYASLKRNGVEVFNYLTNRERLTAKMFQRIVALAPSLGMEKFASNHLSHIFFDEIKKLHWIRGERDVYDLEVPGSHNFIGGNAPCFFHNTVVQHQFAKWADTDIIIFIGCGERGNEMTDVLQEFPELTDPKSGKPLMERTVLIANTSNMPVAAREASIYTGITIAEYYRDMGYKVALTADSTSRWAEALREMSGRLEEMPGEEGYPAYLGTRTAAFYERAGQVETLGSGKRIGSLTVIGAVSPPGGDFSEPVTQNTLRVTKVFWALDSALAYKRHFPAINWLTSYSLYNENLEEYFNKEVAPDFNQYRAKAMEILQEEANLEEIVRLVGFDALGARDQLTLRVARMIREDFLHQNAFDEIDTYTSLAKQYGMIKLIIDFYELAKAKLQTIDLNALFKKEVIEEIARLKLVPEDKVEREYARVWKQIEQAVQ